MGTAITITIQNSIGIWNQEPSVQGKPRKLAREKPVKLSLVIEIVAPLVISSPRQRALKTAELAGLAVDEVSPLLAEWDYGSYEGLTTPQIRESVPDWLVWTDGCPGGESVAQVSDRADRAVALALEQMTSRDVLFVGHSHFSRAVITRWVELPLVEGSRFWMVAASIAVCGFEHGVRQLAALGLTGDPQAMASG